eukprot:CAMPEP_0194570306 /NCGR_PEP_ID=MMETSP0292-20121207/7665_1 /TAXON_ID=39354 /ORGANISM="Heterosigma akashiwo, Strain CCMP2393" /LENGTH=110 /DNA_ID=CAMNT_0039420711 /DNA_START=121 /DNA_END=449 /DNA_ORIENTATION=+
MDYEKTRNDDEEQPTLLYIVEAVPNEGSNLHPEQVAASIRGSKVQHGMKGTILYTSYTLRCFVKTDPEGSIQIYHKRGLVGPSTHIITPNPACHLVWPWKFPNEEEYQLG